MNRPGYCQRCGSVTVCGPEWGRYRRTLAEYEDGRAAFYRALDDRPWLATPLLAERRCFVCLTSFEEVELWRAWLDTKPRNDPRDLSPDDWRRVREEAARLLRRERIRPITVLPVLGPVGALFTGDWLAPNTALAYRSVVLARLPWLRAGPEVLAEAVLMSGIGPDRFVDWTPGYGPPPALGTA